MALGDYERGRHSPQTHSQHLIGLSLPGPQAGHGKNKPCLVICVFPPYFRFRNPPTFRSARSLAMGAYLSNIRMRFTTLRARSFFSADDGLVYVQDCTLSVSQSVCMVRQKKEFYYSPRARHLSMVACKRRKNRLCDVLTPKWRNAGDVRQQN